MTDPRWERQWSLFHDALAREASTRLAWLASTCADDPALAAEVRTLLDAHARASPALDALEPVSAPDARIPAALGPWQVQREVGHGGMGRVFEVQRADGRYAQRAALKLLDPLLAGHAFARRFRDERRILARLEHPNIAALLDAGEDADGRPWLVMRYVDGVPIDRWCRDRQLSAGARIGLVAVVADAVAYAHGQLIVHRDIKPSNVLVEGDGNPVLLDFGIAKDLDRGAVTEAGEARALTPRYASPEQLGGAWAGPASDVYSLGVLLYELLVGAPPYESDGRGHQALAAHITETGPPDVVTAARRAGVKVPAEVGWIIARAMAPEPAARYADARALADDLRALLAHRPLSARAPHRFYVAAKFVRRRWGVVATVLSVAALTALFTWQLSREAERTRAALASSEAERQHAERVAHFLADLFKLADTTRDGGASIDARTLLDRGRARLSAAPDIEPVARARMVLALATTYRNLGAYADARTLLESVLPSVDAVDPSLAIDLRQVLGSVLDLGGDPRAARDILAGILAARLATQPSDPSAIARSELALAAVEQTLGHHAAAGELFASARARAGTVDGDADLRARAALGIGSWHWVGGRLAEAGASYAEALAERRAERPPDLPELARALDASGAQAHAMGAYDVALAHYGEALALRRRVLGDRHRLTADTLSNLGACHYDRGDDASAEPLLREALGIYDAVIAADSPVLAKTLNNLGLVLQRQGRSAEARALISRALAIHRQAYGDQHARVAGNLNNLGMVEEDLGDDLAAAAHYREALAIQRAVLPAAHLHLGYTLTNLGRVTWFTGDRASAETLLREALAVRTAALPDGAPLLADTRAWLGWVLCADAGQAEEGARLLARALESRSAQGPQDRVLVARTAAGVEACSRRTGLAPMQNGAGPTAPIVWSGLPAPMRAVLIAGGLSPSD